MFWIVFGWRFPKHTLTKKIADGVAWSRIFVACFFSTILAYAILMHGQLVPSYIERDVSPGQLWNVHHVSPRLGCRYGGSWPWGLRLGEKGSLMNLWFVSFCWNKPRGIVESLQVALVLERILEWKFEISENGEWTRNWMRELDPHQNHIAIWMFPKIGVPPNGWYIIYNGKPN